MSNSRRDQRVRTLILREGENEHITKFNDENTRRW